MNFIENKNNAESAMKNLKNQSFIIKPGTGKIIFSAPHCVEQTRNGEIKFAEEETGVLAEMLHNELGCHIIRKVSNCNDDANYDEISDYKAALRDYINDNEIEFLIDLHQLSPERDVMINLGTGNLNNLNDKNQFNIFLSTFSKNKVGLILLDEPFSASYKYTISSQIHRECQIPCIQIEINTKLLCENYSEYAYELVYSSLKECHYKLSQIYLEQVKNRVK